MNNLELNELFTMLSTRGYEPVLKFDRGPTRSARRRRRDDYDDAAFLATCRCPHCGHWGLKYSGWRRPDSYRAFATCHECGKTEEF